MDRPDETLRVTHLLARIRAGDQGAEERVYELLADELKRVARSMLRGGPATPTLGVSDLVNEAYLRIAGAAPESWEDRRHFVRYAARAMRSALTDRVRAARASKRKPQGERVPLEGLASSQVAGDLDLMALDEALDRLEQIDPRLTEVVQLRFYGGLTRAAAAQAMGLPEREVRNLWEFARAWLREALD
ncbi:ECF-type sigma factor [Engelhardtia mirabilis]